MPDSKPAPRHLCGKPQCMVPVTAGWPQAARDAYAKANYDHAPTCPAGEAADMRRVNWCYTRAYYHPDSSLSRTAEQIQAQVSI